MLHAQGISKHTCGLLAVICGEISECKQEHSTLNDQPRYLFPDIVSSGRLEVQTLTSPSPDEFRRVFESVQPNFVYFQGEQLQNDEVGSLVWGGVEMSSAEDICGLFGAKLPTTVYLEIPNGDKLAEALLTLKGIPYVIYWKHAFSCHAASHSRNALFSVVQRYAVLYLLVIHKQTVSSHCHHRKKTATTSFLFFIFRLLQKEGHNPVHKGSI